MRRRGCEGSFAHAAALEGTLNDLACQRELRALAAAYDHDYRRRMNVDRILAALRPAKEN